MEWLRRSGRRTTLPLIVALGVGCGVLEPNDYEGERERLAESRERWSSQGFDSYDYLLQRSCYCAGGTMPANVVVRNGERISATIVETGEPVPEPFLNAYLTVAELFDFIEDAIDREAHSIEVAYDEEYGYPTQIRIDYIELAIDEEMAFTASALRPHR